MRATAIALLLLAACGGDESDYDAETNPQGAVFAISTLSGFAAAGAAGSPDSVAGGAIQLSSATQNIILPVFPEDEDADGARARVTGPGVASLVGTCECDATGCEFDGCADENGAFSIDGSVEIVGDTYSWSLSVDQSQGEAGDYQVDTSLSTSGEMTISATLIDGSSGGDGHSSITTTDADGDRTTNVSWDWSMTAHAIELDATRCAVGGTLDASLSAESGSADFSGSGTVAFGPACGEAVAVE